MRAFLENLESSIDMAEFRVFPERKPKLRAPSDVNGRVLQASNGSASAPVRRRTAYDNRTGSTSAAPISYPRSSQQSSKRRNSAVEVFKEINIKGKEKQPTFDLLLKSLTDCHKCRSDDDSHGDLRKILPDERFRKVQILIVTEREPNSEENDFISRIMKAVGLNESSGAYCITVFPKCLHVEEAVGSASHEKCFAFLETEMNLLSPLIVVFFGKGTHDFLQSIGIRDLYGSVPIFSIAEDPADFEKDAHLKKVFWNWLKKRKQYIVDSTAG